MVYTSDAFHPPSDPHGEASLLYFHAHRWMLGKSITRSTPSIVGLFPWPLQRSKWRFSWVALCPLYILCPWRPSHLPPRAPTLPWLEYSLRGHSIACRLFFLQVTLLFILHPSHANLCIHICSMVPQDASTRFNQTNLQLLFSGHDLGFPASVLHLMVLRRRL